MADKQTHGWNISSPVNIAFLLLLLLFGASAIGLSVLDLFGLPMIVEHGGKISDIQALPTNPNFSISFTDASLQMQPILAGDSPYDLNITINTPPLTKDHEIIVYAVANGNVASETTCPDPDAYENDSQLGLTSITCAIPLTYGYQAAEGTKIYATIEDSNADTEYAASPLSLQVDWSPYEGYFWGSAAVVTLIAVACLVVLLIATLVMLFFSTRAKHETEYEGEYTLGNMLTPFKGVKDASHAFQAFIASPLFWLMELGGILVLVVYFAVAVEPWQSPSALFAFFISGILSLVTPFLWVALMWFADYKEREPLRIIVSLFLWGGFACLMAIGINSVTGLFFGICGLAFMAASFTAPIFEELFKGIGLAIFSFHHEYDNMVDGIIYGFVIGMGFSFVEDWLYLLHNPMGGNIWSWLFVFIMRSIFFSANHGVFTAMTGGVIGLLKQWRFPYATLGLAAGMLPAMFLHAVHNSGEIWTTLFGGIGICAYCCILIPVFDYGGLLLVALLLVGGVIFTQGREKDVLPPPEHVKRIFGHGKG